MLHHTFVSYQDFEKNIAAAAGKLTTEEMLAISMTRAAPPRPAGPGDDDDTNKADKDKALAGGNNSDDDEEHSDDNDHGSLAERLANMRKKNCAAAKVAKPTAVATSAAAGPAQASQAGSASDVRCSFVMEDGRTQRLRAGLQEEFTALEAKLDKLFDLRKLNDTGHLFGKSVDFINGTVKPFYKQVKGLENEIKKSTDRIAKSPGRASLADLAKRFTDELLSPLIVLRDAISSCFQDAKANAGEIVERVGALCVTPKMQPSVTMLSVALWSHFEEQTRLGQYLMACNTLVAEGGAPHDLCLHLIKLQSDMTKSKAIGNTIVEAHVLRVAAKITSTEFATNDFDSDKAINRGSLCRFGKAFDATCSTKTDFLPSELRRDIAVLSAFLWPEGVEPALLEVFLKIIAEWEQSTEKLSAIADFLLSPPIGTLICEHAMAFNATHEVRRTQSKATNDIRQHVKDVRELAMNEQTHTNVLIQEHEKAAALMSTQPEKADFVGASTKGETFSWYQSAVRESGETILVNRLNAQLTAVTAWCTDEHPACVPTDTWKDDIQVKLSMFFDDKSKNEFQEMENACRHTCHLLEHFAVNCRLTSKSPPFNGILFASGEELDKVLADKPAFYLNYGDNLLAEAERLADVIEEAESMDDFLMKPQMHTWYNSIPGVCRNLYRNLRKEFKKRAHVKETTAVAFYTNIDMAMQLGDITSALTEGRSTIAALPSGSRVPFTMVDEYLTALIEVKKMLRQVESPSPFSQSVHIKKNLQSGAQTLHKTCQVLHGEISKWVDVGSSSEPVSSQCQKMGFARIYMEQLVAHSDGISESVSNATIQVDINAALSAHHALDDVFSKTPDPDKKEQKFLMYMSKSGQTMNNHSKEMEKAYDRATNAARQCGVDMALVDTNGVGKQVEELKNNVINLIQINTLITLLRAPNIRTDENLQAVAKTVYEKFDGKVFVLMPKYVEEYADIFQPAKKKARSDADGTMSLEI